MGPKVDESPSKKALSNLITKRAVAKRRITQTFKCIGEVVLNSSTLSEIRTYSDLIRALLEEVKNFDDLINEIVCADYGGEEDSEFSDGSARELDQQSNYQISILKQLTVLSDRMSNVVSPQNRDAVQSISNCDLKLPEIKCDSFSGEGTNSLEYHDFLTKYNNVVGLRPNLSKSTKFSYLRSYLRGYALKLVQHLQVSDDNYDTALKLLSEEFLNQNSLIDDLLRKLFELKPKFDTSFLSTKIFISEVRCIVSDLSAYGLDVLGDVAANKIISHVVFHKLPQVFKQEVVRKLGENFPSLENIFDNYVEIVRTLNMCQPPKAVEKPEFLDETNVVWPENELGCLSKESQLLGCPSLADPGGVSGASLADPGGVSGASLAEPGGLSDASLADEEAEPQE